MSARRLLILRHAKSAWPAGVPDRQRPLAPRGQRAASAVGAWLAAAGLTPDRVFTSPAVRAEETARLAAEGGAWQAPLLVSEDLYGARAHALLEFVRGLPDDSVQPILVGHEPASSLLAALLVGGGSLRFPTACVASVRFHVGGWREVAPGSGQLDLLMRPKLLARAAGEA